MFRNKSSTGCFLMEVTQDWSGCLRPSGPKTIVGIKPTKDSLASKGWLPQHNLNIKLADQILKPKECVHVEGIERMHHKRFIIK
jgi:hypothetical protein